MAENSITQRLRLENLWNSSDVCRWELRKAASRFRAHPAVQPQRSSAQSRITTTSAPVPAGRAQLKASKDHRESSCQPDKTGEWLPASMSRRVHRAQSRSAFLLIVLALGACNDRSEPSAANQIPADEVVGNNRSGTPHTRHPLPDPPRPPSAPPIGGLLPLSTATIKRELAPGTKCFLDDSARGPLMAAVAGDAIVNLGGRILHLKTDSSGPGGPTKGGRFVGDGLVVTIQREGQIEQVQQMKIWQATLRIEHGDEALASFHHRWSCSA